MEDLRVKNFIFNLNENLEFILQFNSIDFNISDASDTESEAFQDEYNELIDDLLEDNENEWLEKHLIEHYYEFVDRFSKSLLDKKLLLLVCLTMSDNRSSLQEYDKILINTIKYLVNNIEYFIRDSNSEISECKKMFHLSFCYFLRISLCKLSCSDVTQLADRIIECVLEECKLVTSGFSYESAEVAGDIIKSKFFLIYHLRLFKIFSFI